MTAQPAQRPWWHWLWLTPFNIAWFVYDVTRFCVYDDDEGEVRDGAKVLGLAAIIATPLIIAEENWWGPARVELRAHELDEQHGAASRIVRPALPEAAVGVRVLGCYTQSIPTTSYTRQREVGSVTFINDRTERVDVLVFQGGTRAGRHERDFFSIPARSQVVAPTGATWLSYEIRSPDGVQIGLIHGACPRL